MGSLRGVTAVVDGNVNGREQAGGSSPSNLAASGPVGPPRAVLRVPRVALEPESDGELFRVSLLDQGGPLTRAARSGPAGPPPALIPAPLAGGPAGPGAQLPAAGSCSGALPQAPTPPPGPPSPSAAPRCEPPGTPTHRATPHLPHCRGGSTGAARRWCSAAGAEPSTTFAGAVRRASVPGSVNHRKAVSAGTAARSGAGSCPGRGPGGSAPGDSRGRSVSRCCGRCSVRCSGSLFFPKFLPTRAAGTGREMSASPGGRNSGGLSGPRGSGLGWGSCGV